MYQDKPGPLCFGPHDGADHSEETETEGTAWGGTPALKVGGIRRAFSDRPVPFGKLTFDCEPDFRGLNSQPQDFVLDEDEPRMNTIMA